MDRMGGIFFYNGVGCYMVSDNGFGGNNGFVFYFYFGYNYCFVFNLYIIVNDCIFFMGWFFFQFCCLLIISKNCKGIGGKFFYGMVSFIYNKFYILGQGVEFVNDQAIVNEGKMVQNIVFKVF